MLLTLPEAEAVRAGLHAQALAGKPLTATSDVLCGLRSLMPGADSSILLGETLECAPNPPRRAAFLHIACLACFSSLSPQAFCSL